MKCVYFSITFFFISSIFPAEKEKEETFKGYPVSLLNQSIKQFPDELKETLKKIEHPYFKQMNHPRAFFFLGKPGTGKTTSAIAMGYALRDSYRTKKFTCTSFTKEGRGSTTEYMRYKIKPHLKKMDDGKGCFVIFDEAQEVLDFAGDIHYDTASTGRVITELINESEIKPHLLLLFTANSQKNFPAQIKDRMIGHTFKFYMPNKDLLFYFKREAFKKNFSYNFSQKFLDVYPEIKEKTPSLNIRQLESFMYLCFNYSKIEKGIPHIDDSVFIKAHSQLLEDIKRSQKKPTPSDYEQRERHYTEQKFLKYMLINARHENHNGNGNKYWDIYHNYVRDELFKMDEKYNLLKNTRKEECIIS